MGHLLNSILTHCWTMRVMEHSLPVTVFICICVWGWSCAQPMRRLSLRSALTWPPSSQCCSLLRYAVISKRAQKHNWAGPPGVMGFLNPRFSPPMQWLSKPDL